MHWIPGAFAAAVTLSLLLAGCGEPSSSPGDSAPRWVLTAPVESAERRGVQLSGVVRARHELPLAFQVSGRIERRLIDAGQRVAAGDVLFELDPRDLAQAVEVARADLEAAEAEVATAAGETRRNRDLLEREFISAQAFERFELAEASARERAEAARARLEQATNALDYATLTAREGGVVIDVLAEAGQVVAAGEAVARLALDGPREIAVDLPEAVGEPATGRLLTGPDAGAELRLREVAGAADPTTRTWSARYALVDPDPSPRLGSVVRVELGLDASPDRSAPMLRVPIGAINERGLGPQVWRIVDGRAQPLRVTLVDIDTEYARILGNQTPDGLAPGDEVIALGTHLLESGMPVRALDRDDAP
ncbi:efflux RND transporter periplasmic adaptor subunit [Halomonas denitrificans]|nr:efflux RND transporter periplasmic adaptor subunit [Halomonas denitrificans]